MNLNYILPRLTIRAKLAIAFMMLALLPLMAVGFFGTRSALAELRRSAEEELDYGMEIARARTERAMRELAQHAAFVATLVGPRLADPDAPPDAGVSFAEATQTIESFLVQDPSPLFRFKLIDAYGMRVLEADRERRTEASDGEAMEPLYHFLASDLDPGGRAVLPVEVRSAEDSTIVVPAVAVVQPVYVQGRYVGAVVGEAEAEGLFEGLDASSPLLSETTTALVDGDGRFLFHSEYKRDWASLLPGSSNLGLRSDLPADVADTLLVRPSGTTRLADGRWLTHRRIEFGASPGGRLILYRTLPDAIVNARVRNFLGALALLGAVLVVTVLAASTLASSQITRPVYALSDAARTMTDGGVPNELAVRSNDELEDLADDFNRMAKVITEHRRSLESLVERRTSQLLQTEAHLGRIVTDATDAIVALSPTGEIALWNQGAEELFGYTAEEALGLPHEEVLGSEHEHLAQRFGVDADGDLVGTPLVNVRTHRRAKSGEWIPVTVTRSPIHDEHEVTIGYSLIIRDERARKQLEEQMRRSERLAAISLMAGGIAHELNNPLSILGNRIELMQRDAIRRDAGVSMLEDLEVLRKHVARIGLVAADLIRFAREDEDELVAIDVNEIVDRVTRLLRKIFDEAGVSMEVDGEESLPMVLGSESAVETVLVNLLLNAQQATPVGGTVTVRTVSRDDRTVRLEVADTGPGVPEELQRRVFEPFFTTKAATGGTGLGLAVCRTLVDRVGGTLELATQNGRGASFVVSFPRKVEIEA